MNNNETESDEKPRTVFVGNIPSDASKWDIESIFGEIGPLKRCYIQYPKNFNRSQSSTTVAYVTYALPEDAAAAITKLGSSSIGSNKLSIKLSKPRSIEIQRQTRPRFPQFGFVSEASTRPKEKQPRQKTIKKKSRLIVRNLSFQVTDEKLKEHFSVYGDIQDINILKKPNGKLVGCAFVQYSKVSQAAKALRDLNLKPFMNRPIAIDWALPKAKFQTDEPSNEGEEGEKEDTKNFDIKIKDEPQSEEDEGELKSRGVENPIRKKRKRNDSSSDTDDDVDTKVENVVDIVPEQSKVRKLNPNDADEGKTLFIRNLNFDTTSEKLKEFFLEFGPVNYAVICKDSLTEHSKGTGFVMFRGVEDLQKCLTKYEDDPGHFILDERQFYISIAMSKSKLSDKLTENVVHKEPKDKRNIYLVREGFIRLGTTAADGISPSDLNIRSTLHHHKRQMLKDLNNFVSDKRLCIHNLPEKFSDNQLRSLFLKHGGPEAKITEARIMRDKNVVTKEGFKSKNFGFVTFVDHQQALTALRALNNNPNIFSRLRRPIVEFSVEKKAALKAKQKRMEKSKEKLNQIKTEQAESEATKKRDRKKKKLPLEEQSEKTPLKKKEKKTVAVDQESVPEFGGLTSKAGLSSIPSMKPKGKITRNSLKAKKPKTKKLQPRRKRELKSQSRKDKRGDDKFEKTLSTYKKQNYNEKSSEKNKKPKWYT